MIWLRNTIMLLCNAVTPPVATRGALTERLQSARNAAPLLHERAQQKLGYRQQPNSFVPSVPFLYPLKTSENRNRNVFKGVEKGCIGNKWVKGIAEEQAKQNYIGIKDIRHLYLKTEGSNNRWWNWRQIVPTSWKASFTN